MSFRLPWVSACRLSRLPFLLSLIAFLAALAPGLLAQTAHFSGAIQTLGSGLTFPEGVAVDGSGNVFVADSGNNAVKEIVAAGGYTTVNTLGSGFNYPEGVAVDGSGNVFVGDTYNNAVKEILAAGGYTTVRTLGSGFNSPLGVAVDGNGNVFVADFGNDAVKEILAAGGYTTVNTLRSGAGGLYYGSAHPYDVAVDGSGNVFVSDPSNNAVEEILAASGYLTTTTLASGLNVPDGVAVDGSGNIFFVDQGNHAVKEIMAAGGYTTVNTLGGGFNGFLYPRGVAVDGSGSVFVSDYTATAVKEIVAGGKFGSVNVGASSATPLTLYFTFDTGGTLGSTVVLTKGATGLDFTEADGGTCTATAAYNAGDTCTVNVTFKPTAPGPRYGAAELLDGVGNLLATGYVQGTGVGPQATFATMDTTSGAYLPSATTSLANGFSYPNGLAVDGSGNVFVADTDNNLVKEIVAAGGYTTVNPLGSGFSHPTGVAVDGGGNLFVADSGNNAVKEIVAAGGYTTVNPLGSGFSSPQGVSVDGSGNVFIADSGNNAVKEIVAAGGYTTVNPLGSGFSSPQGVSVDGNGNVFVADSGNHAVKEIVAAGGYTTVNTLGSGFNLPSGVSVDGNGNVFVVDSGNNAVKEIVASGGYTTVNPLGSGFSDPTGVSVDGSGNVFVADSGNNAVKKLDFVDPPSLSFASTTVGTQSSDSPQSVTVSNAGNADLTFPIPPAGTNPSVASGFILDGATTCPHSTAGTLAAATSCVYAVDFVPETSGTISGSLLLEDNNLNAPSPGYATQAIPLSGPASTGVAPSIITLPSSQTVTAGSTATFAAAATGIPTPTVQWQVSSDGGATFSSIKGATSTTLSFSTTASQNGDQYRAVFTNIVSSVATKAATLTVNFAPTITLNPTNQALPPGSTASFAAAASGNPAPTVQWQVSADGGATFSNIAAATSTTLAATATNSQNGYQYRAVFTNSVSTATTTPATLTSEDFAISASPASVAVASGHSASYTVSLASVRGLTGNIAMTCSGGPANLTCAFSPNPVLLNGTARTTVTVFTPKSVKHSTFTLTFTGTLGNIAHSTQVSLTLK